MDESFSCFPVLNILLAIPSELYPLGGVSFILLCLSALVSGSEVAFFSLSPQQVEDCNASKKASESRVAKLIAEPKLLLATILILNNLVNVGLVTTCTYMTWLVWGKESSFAEWFLLIGVTAILVFFGEIVPKVFANQRNLSFAKITSGFLYVSTSVLRPFSWILTRFGDVLERRIERNNKGKRNRFKVSVKELGDAVDMTMGHDTSSEEKKLFKSIVNFGTKTVKQIMRSRIDITAFDIEMDFHVLMDRINKCGYSRIPIYSDTIDNIEGILYVKDLLAHIDKDEHFLWQELIRRDTFFVPETKKIDDLFRDFQSKRVHIAIVADEYGGTSGLISMEDIIEEIVGEINDEFDNDELNYRKLDDSVYVFDAKTSLNDLSKVLNVEPSFFDQVKGESESLGGLMLELFGKLPHAGERISFRKFVFIITSVNQKRIKSVRVRIGEGSANRIELRKNKQ